MAANRVSITVRGQRYTIITDEAPENVIALAGDINSSLDSIMSSGKVSLTEGLILAALDFANNAKQNAAAAEKLKGEIGDYLEDAEKAMTERDKFKRENEKLKERIKKQ